MGIDKQIHHFAGQVYAVNMSWSQAWVCHGSIILKSAGVTGKTKLAPTRTHTQWADMLYCYAGSNPQIDFCSGLISFLLFPPFLEYWFHWAMVRGGRDAWRQSPLCMSTNAARMLLFLGIPVLMFLGLSQWQLSHVIWYMMWIMKIMFLACGHLRTPRLHVTDYVAQNTDPLGDAAQRVGIPELCGRKGF